MAATYATGPSPSCAPPSGYIEQDAPVLAAILRDNLRFAAPHASDDDIHDVVLRTRLDDLLARLPDGLDTVLGHRGTTLSGGQWRCSANDALRSFSSRW
jgi:ABC-type multidrug transport system fused ATPase/permease subunit